MKNPFWKATKSFWLGSIAAAVLAVVAGFALTSNSMTTAAKFSSSSTRL